MLTPERIRELLDYEPDSGNLVWKETRRGIRGGRIAGFKRHDGYISVRIDSSKYYAHRLVWIHVTGTMPAGEIDHIDCNPSDNRIENLRLATPSQNQANHMLSSRNTSGIKGVTWDASNSKWKAQIGWKRKNIYLGLFESKDEAAAAVSKKRSELHGQYANHGKPPAASAMSR